MTGAAPPPVGRTARAGRALSLVLYLLTVFGPISMDLYLPALPALTADLVASTSVAQLTVTACLIGLAVGQLIAGPLSDRFGRRRPVLIGVVLYVLVSLACAFSPTVQTLIAARFVQGLAGAVGIVIARSVGRDVYEGGHLIRFYGRLTVLGGFAAIVGPVIGGQLAGITDWRGVFLFLAGVGAVILLAAALFQPETLPAPARTRGGIGTTVRHFGLLLSDRAILGAVLVTGLLNAALFAYLSGATYVLQDSYGLSPQGYSFAFAFNSFGFMIFGWAGGRLADRWSERRTLALGIASAVLGAAGILATGLAGLPLWGIVASLFIMVSGVALAAAPATALALAGHSEIAGTASSLIGQAQFLLGGISAPFVGVTGAADVTIPLGVVALVSTVLAIIAGLLVRKPRTTDTAAPRPVDVDAHARNAA